MDELLATGLEPLWRVHGVLGVAFGLAAGVVGIWHELRWRTRLKAWKKTTGMIVDEIWEKDDECGKPVIEFDYDGETKRFTSEYGRENIKVSTQTDVIYHPLTGQAEELTWSNRWFFTLIPLLIFVGGIVFYLWEL